MNLIVKDSNCLLVDDEFAKLDAALGSLVVGVGHKTSKSVHILQV